MNSGSRGTSDNAGATRTGCGHLELHAEAFHAMIVLDAFLDKEARQAHVRG